MRVEDYLRVEEAFVEVLKHSGFMNDENAYSILGAVRHTLERRGVIIPDKETP